MKVFVSRNRMRKGLALNIDLKHLPLLEKREMTGEGGLDYRFIVFLFIMGKRGSFYGLVFFFSTRQDPDMYKS